MSYKIALYYFNNAVQFLNSKLALPTNFLQYNLSLKTDILPEILQRPINFSTMFILLLFIIFTYANSLICNLIGVLYPILYSLNLFNDMSNTDSNNTIKITNKFVTLNKYWMLFGSITLMDTFFGFIFDVIPGYYYLKVGLIYTLIRNDFSLTNGAFGLFYRYYRRSNILPIVQGFLESLNSKLFAKRSSVIIPNNKIE